MKILITNDDGINASGLKILANEISKNHEVIIVAPREQQSAASHSLSINHPIRVKKEQIDNLKCKAYSVLGTPADCVLVAFNLLKEKVDIVISGINKGLNIGIDTLYSGTVSAAMEASIHKVPSIAISLDWNDTSTDKNYLIAAKWVEKVITLTKDHCLHDKTLLNVNVPNIPEDKIKGLQLCDVGDTTYNTEFIYVEGHDDKVFKLDGKKKKVKDTVSDNYFISQGYVTLTPLQFNFTDYNLLWRMKYL